MTLVVFNVEQREKPEIRERLESFRHRAVVFDLGVERAEQAGDLALLLRGGYSDLEALEQFRLEPTGTVSGLIDQTENGGRPSLDCVSKEERIDVLDGKQGLAVLAKRDLARRDSDPKLGL